MLGRCHREAADRGHSYAHATGRPLWRLPRQRLRSTSRWSWLSRACRAPSSPSKPAPTAYRNVQVNGPVEGW